MYAVAFFAGSWPPSPGLRALGDLDLELLGRGRGTVAVTPKRADATCLIRASWRSPSRSGRVPGRVLAALAGVRGAAGALDADRQRLVGLRRERADATSRDTTNRRTMSRAGSTSASGDRRPTPRGRRIRSRVADDRRGAGQRRPMALERGVDRRRRRANAEADWISATISGARTGGPRRRPGSGRSPGSWQLVRRQVVGAIARGARAPAELRARRASASPIRPGPRRRAPGSSGRGRRRRARSSRTARRRCTRRPC